VYSEKCDIKIGQVWEFVGVYCSEQQHHHHQHDHHDKEHSASQAPRLHCVALAPVRLPHMPYDFNAINSARKQAKKEQVRAELLAYLVAVCGGDKLVAELLLVHLVSRVYERHDRMGPRGNLALHIQLNSSAVGAAGASEQKQQQEQLSEEQAKKFAARLAALYKTLLPRACHMKLAGAFNKTLCSPRTNPETHMLEHGTLQAAEGTAFIVDETVLQEGKIHVRNLASIEQVLNTQTLEYLFEGGTSAQWPVDTPMLLVSFKKSLFKADAASASTRISVPLQLAAGVRASELAGLVPTPTPKQLTRWRAYLHVARRSDWKMGTQVQERIGQNYHQLRVRFQQQQLQQQQQQLQQLGSDKKKSAAAANKKAGTNNPLNPLTLQLLLELMRLLSITQLNANGQQAVQAWEHTLNLWLAVHERNAKLVQLRRAAVIAALAAAKKQKQQPQKKQ
jgi:hypothetical protein